MEAEEYEGSVASSYEELGGTLNLRDGLMVVAFYIGEWENDTRSGLGIKVSFLFWFLLLSVSDVAKQGCLSRRMAQQPTPWLWNHEASFRGIYKARAMAQGRASTSSISQALRNSQEGVFSSWRNDAHLSSHKLLLQQRFGLARRRAKRLSLQGVGL